MALNCYHEARDNLFKMLANTRELVSSIAIATKNDQSQSAKEWRNEVAYYSCLLLRLCMAVCDYEDDKIVPWNIPELHGKIKVQLLMRNRIKGHSGKWAHIQRRSEVQEVYRTPIYMAFYLRSAISDQSKKLTQPVNPLSMVRFNAKIDELMQGYQAQIRLVGLGFAPFPVVQISRTMMFLWVFSLPLAIGSSDNSSLVAHIFLVFFMTYAFFGLETMAMELENPFGHDENDFDNLGLARVVFEDIYAMIDITDGLEWAMKVRENMDAGIVDRLTATNRGDTKERIYPTEGMPLLDA